MSDIVKEKWTQWVALTTVILAVCAAIGTLKGGQFATKVQLATTQESNRWAYFQSKSIKQHATETQRDTMAYFRLGAKTPAEAAYLDGKLKQYEAEIRRYDKEKNEIKTDAEKKGTEENELKRHSSSMGLAVMLLQIGIMLSSMSALLKRKPLWLVGLCAGALGIGYLLNGLYLWF